MPEIKPDLTDKSRCVSVHWNLPVQCVLPAGHHENWHEAWHPQTGNRMRYCRSMGVYASEELHHGAWHDLEIPPPGGYCNDQHSHQPHVRCTQQYGHQFSWNHTATVDGCRYTWNTPPLRDLTPAQLGSDVKQLRGMAYGLAAQLEQARRIAVDLENENTRLTAELDKYVGKEPTRDEEMQYLTSCLDAVLAVCDAAEKQATRWENPLPVPEWVETVRKAAEGGA